MTKKTNPPAESAGTLTRALGPLSSFNKEARTVDIVLATETPVRRRSYGSSGDYDEVLVVSREAIDTAHLGSMVLLDQHDGYSGLDARLGSVVPGSLRFEGRTAVVTVKISRNAKGEALFNDLEDGHVLPASVGYRPAATERTDAAPGRVATVRVTRWTPMELSIVSVPADPNASTRSAETELHQEHTATMTRAEINAEIRSIANVSGLDQIWIDSQVDAEATAEQARAAAFEAMKVRSTSVRAPATVTTDHTDPDAIRSAMADALAHRLAPGVVKLEGRATEYRGHAVLDLVGDLAIARGERINLRDREGLLERAVGAHSTSDFPLLLSNAANKALLSQYAVAAPTYRKWAARKPFADFKAHQFLRVGDVPAFKEVHENGEFKYGTISENAEKVTAKEFGTGIAIGRRALINDDLSALSDFSSGIAIRAANDENKLAYGVIKANGNLSDGKALFHADHKNLPTAAAFGAATVQALVKALRAQTSLDGLPLNLQPAYLVVGPDLEVAARTLLTAISATKTADVNPWAGFAELVVDANLGATEHYVFASPSAAPVVVYGYVAGAEGPQIRSERDFDTQAVKVAASLDFAVGAIDYRGAVKNSGA